MNEMPAFFQGRNVSIEMLGADGCGVADVIFNLVHRGCDPDGRVYLEALLCTVNRV